MEQNKRVALITGGSQGIGKACVLKFHGNGIHTVFCDLNKDKGEKVLEEAQLQPAGSSCHFIQADASKEEDVERVVRETLELHGRLDYLVNNVGVYPPAKTIDEFTVAELEQTFRINVVSAFLFSQKSLPHIRKVKGSIVNLESCVVTMGQPKAVTYTLTKAAIHGLTVSLAVDESVHGVRVNSVAPGATNTPFLQGLLKATAEASGTSCEEMVKYETEYTLLKKLADPLEVAAAVLYLARDATHTTGEVLDVSAGTKLAKAF